MSRIVMRLMRLAAGALAGTALVLPVGCTDPGPNPIPSGVVTGAIVSAATGLPIAGATIRSGTESATSGADGLFSVSARSGDRVMVRIRAAGFAPTLRVARVAPGVSSHLKVPLLPVGASQTLSVGLGGSVRVPSSTAEVVLPANGLEPETGNTASDVTVQITAINPVVDVGLMPGDYTTTVNGSTRTIESFGALLVEVTDATGTSYDLKGNTSAMVRIPLGSRSDDPPSSIPLFYMDENTGRWVQEGTATLRGSGSSRYYEGTVTHFSAWNADRIEETILVSGCVVDSAGRPVVGALVQSDGIDYSGSATSYTRSDGTFTVAMRRNGRARITAQIAGQSSNAVVAGPSSVDFTLPECLVMEPLIQVAGCVRDASNQPVVNAVVTAVGLDYSGSSFAVTRNDGTFTLMIRRNGTAEITAQTDLTVTNTIIAGPSASDFTLPDCLRLVSVSGCGYEVAIGGGRPETRFGANARWVSDATSWWVVYSQDLTTYAIDFLLEVTGASPVLGSSNGVTGWLLWTTTRPWPGYWSAPTSDPSDPFFGTSLNVSVSSIVGPVLQGSATGVFHRTTDPTATNPLGLTGEFAPATVTFCAIRQIGGPSGISTSNRPTRWPPAYRPARRR